MERDYLTQLRWELAQWYWVPPWDVNLSTPDERTLVTPTLIKAKLTKGKGSKPKGPGAVLRVIQKLYYRGSRTHHEIMGAHQRKAVLPFRGKGHKVERRSKKRG